MTSSDDEEDAEYVIHGQLLDPIREDEIVKRKDSEQQFVKDENGRRRFHGAFTGGFSAGFYNTVGSLEGWTPSTFKSSRSSKFTPKQQNAYDFMDEEDKKDLGIDSSSLKIKAEYSDQSSRKRQLPEFSTGPIPGKPVLGEILKPTTTTWGVELLKSMGWKPGQGIGPQITQREKLRTKKELENVGMKSKTNTKYDDDDFEINELLDNFKVSPYEYESVAIKPKTDTFGLGYKCLQTSNVSLKFTDKPYSKLTVDGKSIHGQAFGIGAYENEDYDIYSTDNLSNYDFSLDPKSPNSKNKSKYNKVDPDCIDGFIESSSKHQFYGESSSLAKIPPEWCPQGMFDRILGQSIPDFFTSSFNEVNVNSRQREIKKIAQLPFSDLNIKKEPPRSILPDIMFDRFTRAVLPDDSTNALIPVERTFDPTLVRLKDYADKKMYGFWTRKTETWTPEKLLCKRFNVPLPKQSIDNRSESDVKIKTQCSLFSSLEFGLFQPGNVEGKTSDCVPLAVNEQISEGQEPFDSKEFNKDTAVEFQKPSVDFFKDIFLDSSDDETLNVQQPSVKKEEEPTSSNNDDTCATEISSEHKETAKSSVSSTAPLNIFPAKGIFANLNFDELFDTPKTNSSDKNTISQVNDNQFNSTHKFYGPFLPEQNNLKASSVNPIIVPDTFSDDEWVEKVESPNRKINHSKKHSKHKKSKSKRKSTKKSRKHK